MREASRLHYSRKLADVSFIVIIILLALIGYQRISHATSETAVQIQLVSPIMPSLMIEGQQFILRALDKNDNLINDAQLQVRGDRDHGGMEPLILDLESAGEGLYFAPVDWPMAGNWTITAKVTLANGSQAQSQFNLFVDGDQSICKSTQHKND
ncbi:MAG: hypothetical protein GY805_19150 [Chloroflexi bacterium]|nr:hypothetical protein [Chloroflexota bacterium]